ncbi:MAG: LysM peptidoglycan-binding domain-containing protein [Planctomycetota bacterium]|nr:LysM peptidoglycan-binding domain-containing protein [Planctomycetota bacterium]
MKRDARIGLAVVLVLGLSVTLLVARALHRHANEEEARAAAPAEHAPDLSAEQESPAAGPTQDIGEQSQWQEVDRFANGRPNGANADQPGMTNPAPGNTASNNTATGFNNPQPGSSNTANTTPTGSSRADVVDVPADPNGMRVPASNNTYIGEPNAGDLNVHGQPPAVPEPQTYTVVGGDNPYKISAKLFGDGKYARKLMDANPGVDPNRLKIGQKLKVPAIQGVEAQPVTASSTAAVPSPAPGVPAGAATTYTVKNGDTLAAIAKNQLGSSGPKTIQKILDANPGTDPRRLKVGAILKIPAAQ